MNHRNDYEPVISVKDLLFHVLYHWRSCVLVALAVGLFLGLWQNYRIDSVHSEGLRTEEEEQYELKLQEYHDSVENEKTRIENTNRQIQEYTSYLNESIWVKLDESTEWEGTLTWSIQSTTEEQAKLPQGSQIDPADYALNAYQGMLLLSLSEKEKLDLFGTDQMNLIQEIVRVETNARDNTLNVTVEAAEKETAEKALQKFRELVEGEVGEKAQGVSGHTRILITDSLQQGCSQPRGTRSTQIAQYQNQIETWQKNVKTAQQTLNGLIRDGEPNAPGKHLVRYAVIGILLGGLMTVIFHVVKYILGGKIHTSNDLAEPYVLLVYGDVPHSRARCPGKGIDGLLEKMEFAHAERDADKVYDGISALIQEHCQDGQYTIVSTLPQEKLKEAKEKLEARLKHQAELNLVSDYNGDTFANQRIGDADFILIMEAKHVSRRADIQRMAELMTIDHRTVDGCVTL